MTCGPLHALQAMLSLLWNTGTVQPNPMWTAFTFHALDGSATYFVISATQYCTLGGMA